MNTKLFLKINKILTLTLSLIFILVDLGKTSFAQKEDRQIKLPQLLVAHAGGAIYGFKYTNSLEALDESYRNGFKQIELDFEWTSDGKIVLIHDWDSMVRRMFMSEPRVYSLYEFKNSKTFQDFTIMDIDDLANWLEERKDVSIVTDVKTRNIDFLKFISQNYKNIQDQIIPQIYSFEEYDPVKNMGYEDIILTLYKADASDNEVLEFVKENPVFAIAMPVERGYSNLPMQLKEIDIFTYVHTVNDFYIFEELSKNGVSGIYTDNFQPNRFTLY